MSKEKYYIEMAASECRPAYIALMLFRNVVIAKGIDPVDINGLIRRLITLE